MLLRGPELKAEGEANSGRLGIKEMGIYECSCGGAWNLTNHLTILILAMLL
jgi:hypothetical protein